MTMDYVIADEKIFVKLAKAISPDYSEEPWNEERREVCQTSKAIMSDFEVIGPAALDNGQVAGSLLG